MKRNQKNFKALSANQIKNSIVYHVLCIKRFTVKLFNNQKLIINN